MSIFSMVVILDDRPAAITPQVHGRFRAPRARRAGFAWRPIAAAIPADLGLRVQRRDAHGCALRIVGAAIGDRMEDPACFDAGELGPYHCGCNWLAMMRSLTRREPVVRCQRCHACVRPPGGTEYPPGRRRGGRPSPSPRDSGRPRCATHPHASASAPVRTAQRLRVTSPPADVRRVRAGPPVFEPDRCGFEVIGDLRAVARSRRTVDSSRAARRPGVGGLLSVGSAGVS